MKEAVSKEMESRVNGFIVFSLVAPRISSKTDKKKSTTSESQSTEI